MSDLIRLSLIGLSIVAISFLITLWLTEPSPQRSGPLVEVSKLDGIAVFKTFDVHDDQTLLAAAKSSHLRPSDQVQGWVEDIVRLDKRRSSVRGWAVDLATPGASASIVIFAAGTGIAELATRGPRLDVGTYLNLPAEVVANAAFEGIVLCDPHQPLIFIGVSQSNLYASLGHYPGALVCPS